MKKNQFFLLGLLFLKPLLVRGDLVSHSYGYKNPAAISRGWGDINNFALLDHNGKFHELYRDKYARAVVIISQDDKCRIDDKTTSVINSVEKNFSSKNIKFYFINSNNSQSRKDIISNAQLLKTNVPILLDPSQTVAKILGFTYTSQAVILDPVTWKILSRFSLSNNNDLKKILNELGTGKAALHRPGEEIGCKIIFTDNSKITYEKDVAPILQSKCLNCHGQTGGFLPKFQNHKDIQGWSAMIKETILTDRMPPWSADDYYGKFANDISLSPKEKNVLITWLLSGAPKSGTTDPLINFRPVRINKFKNIPEIYSAEMGKEAIIPPSGEVEYKYFQLGGPVPFDMWVKGMHVISTNPRQLHHESIMAVSHPLDFYLKNAMQPSDLEKKSNGDFPLYTRIAIHRYEDRNTPYGTYFRSQVWAAGKKQPFYFTRNYVGLIPKGTYLILESHYMGTGKEEKEKTLIKFFGFKNRPEGMKQQRSWTLTKNDFEIPPEAKDFVVETPEWKPSFDLHLTSILGHLHMRGKSFEIIRTNENGKKEVVVSIPNFYYGWQTGAGIVPIRPIAVNSKSSIKGVCHYDNSSLNPYNPDPKQTVRYGQRVDYTEMCKINLGFIFDLPDHIVNEKLVKSRSLLKRVDYEE